MRHHPAERSLRGKGRRARICRKCRRLPREQQEALLNENEIHGFLEQSHISKKNVARLRKHFVRLAPNLGKLCRGR